MKSTKFFHLLSLCSALALLAALPACDAWDMSPKSDFAEKAMEQHMQNGEMNSYQYQDNVKVFLKPGETAPDPNAPQSLNTAKSNAPAATAPAATSP